ncbi:uncharacterized protein K441DRAFT_263065 [Cenococcum geophilum 1.58]|uniref:uncharacterized protein n=1 Tax=Cenococcum geophilum 1.58 TaxID=794803 RepID=UPI00358EC894|nr:hypothetical protein K441DRAFT_263065 [Cenococcum geophilum 1.58]
MGLLIFSYWPFLYLLGRHVSVADAAKTMYGQVWDLRLSHLVVYKITTGRNDHQVLHGCSDGYEIQRLPGNRLRDFPSQFQFTIFVSRSNTLIVVQEHDMLEEFLTRMRATKIEALRQKERFNTVPNHKSGGSRSEADRNWPAEGGIACRPTDTLCLAAKVEDTPWGFVGEAQKKISWRIICG